MLERPHWCTAWTIAMLLLMLHAPGARAQVALDQLSPQPLASDGFAVGNTTLLRKRAWTASTMLDYGNDPLVYRLDRGPHLQQRVVSDQLALQLGAAVGVHSRVTLFVNLPVQLAMRGDSGLVVPNLTPEGAGLGDLALAARVAILEPEHRVFSLVGELIARLPTAELTRPSQRYSGDRAGSYEAAALGGLRLGALDVRLRLGIRLRDAVHLLNLDLGQSLTFATAAQVRLPGNLSLHAELFGATYLSHPFRQHHTPVELLLGPKYRHPLGWVGVAAGPGLVDGYGSPDFRVLGSIGFAKPSPRSGESLRSLPDRDRDGVIDSVDGCPEEREDPDLFQDADGCPDDDNDGDGLADLADACPRDAEDRDGTEDGDGCPELDDDADGVLDEQDRCRDEPGVSSNEGCPVLSEPPAVEPSVEFGNVLFANRRDQPAPTSMPTLRAVSSILHHNPQLERVRIEGHADDTGDATFNDELSAKRARRVAQWLTQHGIAADRLELVACGRRYPLPDESSEKTRVRNRRVEFFELGSRQQPLRDCRPVAAE